MRDSLKECFSNQVVLEDTSIFYYSISPYELKNALEHNIAALQEYNFAKKGDINRKFRRNYIDKSMAISINSISQKQVLK